MSGTRRTSKTNCAREGSLAVMDSDRNKRRSHTMRILVLIPAPAERLKTFYSTQPLKKR